MRGMSEAIFFIQDFAIIMLAAAFVGWGCKRIGLSPIVGYLLAGLIIGTKEITIVNVTNPDRVQVLAQVGVVFLMFSIGLNFRLRRFRELGLPLVGATVLTALFVLNLSRGLSPIIGLTSQQGLFVAAMFMVSSSAVIGKVLMESRVGHQRFGQLAMGITLLEDIVAVVMLTFLSSFVALEKSSAQTGEIIWQISLLVGFALLMILTGLVIVPRLLKKVVRAQSQELETVLVAGLLFTFSVLAVRADYSLALGAFLIGMTLAETPRLNMIERTFSGLRDVFTTVFFVSVGMTMNIHTVPSAIGLIVFGTVFALLLRPICAAFGLLAACEDSKTALRAGLCLTPIGEFSFIIAALGVTAGVLDEKFQAAAVGISLFTGILSPMLISRNEAIAAKIVDTQLFQWLDNGLDIYRGLLQSLAKLQESNMLLKLSRKRLVQIGIEIILITAILVFSRSGEQALIRWGTSKMELSESVVSTIYWIAILGICLVPLLAIWRNIGALTLIICDFVQIKNPQFRRVSPFLAFVVRAVAGFFLLLWFWNFLPIGELRGWFLVILLITLIALAVFGWKRMIYWHSQIEVTFEDSLSGKTKAKRYTLPPWALKNKGWGLSLEECVIPDQGVWAGKSIQETGLRARTGCSIASIERHGFRINNPGPQSHLFPGDRLLLLGEPEQLEKARAILREEQAVAPNEEQESIHDTVLETVVIPERSPVEGRTLAELNWPRLFTVQIAGIRRGGAKTLIPGGDYKLQVGDEVLLLGSAAHIRSVNIQISPSAIGTAEAMA